MKTTESSLIFLGYKIIDIDYKINHEYNKDYEVIQLSPILNFEIIKFEKIGVIVIDCDIFGKEESPFSLNVVIESGFDIQKVPEKDVDQILRCNAVAIVYPYLRSAIANITAAANINILNLPIINVGELAKDVVITTVENKK